MRPNPVSVATLVGLCVVAGIGPLSAAGAWDDVADVVEAMRAALGGDRVAALTALSAEGPFRRTMGAREMEGTVTLLIVRPDKLRRLEEMSPGGMVGGPTIERLSAFNGTDAWEDLQNRGGGPGGGMQILMRGPGDGAGPGAGGRGGPGGMATPEQVEQARIRRMKMELHRWSIVFFAESPVPFAHAGVAESPDGQADILETTDEAGRTVRLFVDQATRLPLMLQYEEIRPRMMVAGRGGRGSGGAAPGSGPPPERPSREEMERRVEELRAQGGPKPSSVTMHLDEYKKVDGVMLPHRFDISVEGEPAEEWVVDRYRVNPPIKAGDFEKPKK